MQGEREFWLVWNGGFNRGDSPKHKHYSEVEAQAEAKRLAALNPDTGFYVLKGVSVAKKPTVIVEKLVRGGVPFRDGEEIPF